MWRVTILFTNGASIQKTVMDMEYCPEKVLEDYFASRKMITKLSWRKLHAKKV